MVTAREPDPDADLTENFPLLIAVAASPGQRVRLAELVDDVAPLLLVSSLDELRRLLVPTQPPPPAEQPGPSDPEAADATTTQVSGEDQRPLITDLRAG